MKKKLKPLDQVVKEMGFKRSGSGYTSPSFYIPGAMKCYFGTEQEFEIAENNNYNGVLYIGPTNEENEQFFWDSKMFEDDFFSEEDFEI